MKTHEFKAKPVYAALVAAGVCSPPGELIYAMVGWLFHEGGPDVMPITHTHKRYFNYAGASR